MEWLGTLAKAVVSVVVAIGTMIGAAAAGPEHPSPAPPIAITAVSSEAAASRIIVRFKPLAAASAVDSAKRAANASDHGLLAQLGARVLSVTDPRAALASLRASSVVEYAEADTVLSPTDTLPNDPYFPMESALGGEWGSFKTQATKAWDITTGNSAVIVADIDSGVAPGLPDLVGQLVSGYNVLNGTADTTDTYGHGTYVAGVISATANNAVGLAGYCWFCKLMPVKVYSSSSAYVSDVAAGITWAVDHGARVLNISLAGTSTSTTLTSAVAYARQRGALVVAAAGNSGCNCPTYPASTTGAVGVAASDQLDGLYSYSNYGTWVKLAAPGQNLTTWPNGSYGAIGGTSMAAPVVAGIAALLFSANPSATVDAVENALIASGDPVASANTVRYGRVNAYKALLAFGAAATTAPTSSPSLAPTPTPVASPTPTPSPTPVPTPAPTGTPPASSLSTSTASFSGAITPKNSSRSFSVLTGAGTATVTLTFSKLSSLTLTVYGADGTVLVNESGATPLSLTVFLPAGTSALLVGGAGQSSFTLTITYRTP